MIQPGIINKIEDKLEKVGDVIQEKLEAARNFLESEWNKPKFGPALANFVTGAQIQLISKASGHSLHIVQDPSGELVVEGKGDIGPQAWNATETTKSIFTTTIIFLGLLMEKLKSSMC